MKGQVFTYFPSPVLLRIDGNGRPACPKVAIP